MPVTIVDIRPLVSNIEGLTFLQDDATKLSTVPSNSIASLSSLHVAEHFGLGRYSDPVDPQAYFRFMESLARVLTPGGRLYFSVPLGKEKVEFNAHRVFNPNTILDRFSGLRLQSFSYVGDDNALYLDAAPTLCPRAISPVSFLNSRKPNRTSCLVSDKGTPAQMDVQQNSISAMSQPMLSRQYHPSGQGNFSLLS